MPEMHGGGTSGESGTVHDDLTKKQPGKSRHSPRSPCAVMAERGFSNSFRRFVNRYITSVEQIEVLLILRANPERTWTINEISAILRSSANSILSRLTVLERSRFAAGDPQSGYRYTANGTLDEQVQELEREYGLRRFSVIELVFSKPDAARSFAEAFRLREEDDGDNG
jgi:hypothetical protein